MDDSARKDEMALAEELNEAYYDGLFHRFNRNHLEKDVLPYSAMLLSHGIDHVAYSEPGLLYLAPIDLLSGHVEQEYLIQQNKGDPHELESIKDALTQISYVIHYNSAQTLRKKLGNVYRELHDHPGYPLSKALVIENLVLFAGLHLPRDSRGRETTELGQAIRTPNDSMFDPFHLQEYISTRLAFDYTNPTRAGTERQLGKKLSDTAWHEMRKDRID